MSNGLVIAMGFIILVAGLLLINSVPAYFTVTHKLFMYLSLFVTTALVVFAGFRKD